jgi:hypothetical protein
VDTEAMAAAENSSQAAPNPRRAAPLAAYQIGLIAPVNSALSADRSVVVHRKERVSVSRETFHLSRKFQCKCTRGFGCEP